MTESSGGIDGRTRVLSAVESAPAPLSVDEVCAATGLHANTVRTHLDVLLAAGSIVREQAESNGRGRPRWLYRAEQRVASPFRYLAEALTAQLAQTSDAALADAAADRWAQAIPSLPEAHDPDEAVHEAVDALNRLGFQAIASPVGDAIAVNGCPYADIVDDNPVICTIHAALVDRLLEQTGQPVQVTSMDVWTRRDMCVARLNRPDLRPTRTISVNSSSSARLKGKNP